MPLVLFTILALISTGAAIMMVVNRSPVRSALFLVVTFLCVAVFYITLSAQFLAAVQVIVYAGAIMVLFLFVIMLLNLGMPEALRERGSMQPAAAVTLGTIFIIALTLSQSLVSIGTAAAPAAKYADQGTAQAIGINLFDKAAPWLLPFEATSILLLIAIIGAIIMAKRRI